MKRSDELTPLSHDHHQALFVAMSLRRADVVEEAATALMGYWNEHGRRHFEIEEGILLPGWLAADENADLEAAARVAREHLEIRAAVRLVDSGQAGLDDLHRLGEQLNDHVRFEERVLFPLIEQRVAADELARIGAEIEAAESASGGSV